MTADDRNSDTTTGAAAAAHDPSPHYEIRVKGRLAPRWSAWFDGLTIDTEPGLMAGLNVLLIGSVMYRSRMLPRWIPTLGLIGAPLLLISDTATLFGIWEQTAGPALLLVLPVAIWEFSFGIYMTVKASGPTATTDKAPVPTISPSLVTATA